MILGMIIDSPRKARMCSSSWTIFNLFLIFSGFWVKMVLTTTKWVKMWLSAYEISLWCLEWRELSNRKSKGMKQFLFRFLVSYKCRFGCSWSYILTMHEWVCFASSSSPRQVISLPVWSRGKKYPSLSVEDRDYASVSCPWYSWLWIINDAWNRD